uniref:Uncharacterized protein n=1 Tax=Timema douglasi TaxID=61478 RepID=A0A7R8VIN7_TIMDO|nr:unnamed protein product [Timema douglasi]
MIQHYMIMGRRYYYRAPRFNHSSSEPYPSAAVNTAPSEQHVFFCVVSYYLSGLSAFEYRSTTKLEIRMVEFRGNIPVRTSMLRKSGKPTMEKNISVQLAEIQTPSTKNAKTAAGTIPPQFLNCYNTICLLLLCICANCYFHGVGIQVCNSNSSSSNDSDIRLKNFSSVGHLDIGQLTESPSRARLSIRRKVVMVGCVMIGGSQCLHENCRGRLGRIGIKDETSPQPYYLGSTPFHITEKEVNEEKATHIQTAERSNSVDTFANLGGAIRGSEAELSSVHWIISLRTSSEKIAGMSQFPGRITLDRQIASGQTTQELWGKPKSTHYIALEQGWQTTLAASGGVAGDLAIFNSRHHRSNTTRCSPATSKIDYLMEQKIALDLEKRRIYWRILRKLIGMLYSKSCKDVSGVKDPYTPSAKKPCRKSNPEPLAQLTGKLPTELRCRTNR